MLCTNTTRLMVGSIPMWYATYNDSAISDTLVSTNGENNIAWTSASIYTTHMLSPPPTKARFVANSKQKKTSTGWTRVLDRLVYWID